MNLGILTDITENELEIAIKAIKESREKATEKYLEQQFSNFISELYANGYRIKFSGGKYVHTWQDLMPKGKSENNALEWVIWSGYEPIKV